MRIAPLLLLLLSACGTSSSEVRRFLGPEITGILERAGRVETLRIDGSLEARESGAAKVGDYPILSTGPQLNRAQSDRLRELLFDGANWQFNLAKGCEFMPGVDFRFVAGAEQVDVLLCFSCDKWAFLHGDRFLVEDNDRARGALLRLACEAFPEDEVLRSLR